MDTRTDGRMHGRIDTRRMQLQPGQSETFLARRNAVILCAEGELRLSAPCQAWQGSHEIAMPPPPVTLRAGQAYQLEHGGIVVIRATRHCHVYLTAPVPLLRRWTRALLRQAARLRIRTGTAGAGG